MPRKVEPLTQKKVDDLIKAGVAGRYTVGGAPGGSLQLVIYPAAGSKAAWVLRTRVDGKLVERKLGWYAKSSNGPQWLTLTQARDGTIGLRTLVKAKQDPRSTARARRVQEDAEKAAAEERASRTFEAVARLAHGRATSTAKNVKHRAQWISSLEKHAFPVLGAMPVDEVDVAHIAAVLEPIWATKKETAARVLQRIQYTLTFAEVYKWRGPPPSRKAMGVALGKQDRSDDGNHPALPVDELPRFMVALRGVEGMGARALEFAILTATRSGEVRGARWGEVDMGSATWAIPAARMKMKKAHDVPLSAAALTLLQALPQGKPGSLIFPGLKRGQQLSDMTLGAAIRRLHKADLAAGGAGFVDPKQGGRVATAHGFRSTFRNWCSENAVPREVAERALAHAVADKTERSYLRTPLFPQRRPVMEAWAGFALRDAAAIEALL